MTKVTSPKRKIGKFIDPLTDFGFKRLFGGKHGKELLIDFLNELLNGDKIITDLTYNKNENLGPRYKSRKTIFDLTCTGPAGEQFIIEVQRIRQQFFRDRAIYYSSRLIHDQAPQGKDWDYSLKGVFFIGIMDFVFDDSELDHYLHRVKLAYQDSGKIFYDKMEFIFIEMPKFALEDKGLKTGIDKWLYILKNLNELNNIPRVLNPKLFAKLFDIAITSKLTKEEFMKYEKDLMAAWDEYAIKKTLIEEGKEEGREEGREEGITKGREKEKKLFVERLLVDGEFAIARIAKLADVSEDFVIKIKRKLKQTK